MRVWNKNHRQTLTSKDILNLPDKVGVTATLNINYKAPTRADQFIVLKIHLDEAQGRKAKVTGTVEDMNGKVLVEAKYVLLQPSLFFVLLMTAVCV